MIYIAGYGMIEMAHIAILESCLKEAKEGVVVELGCGNTPLSTEAFWSKRYIAIEKDKRLYPKSATKNVTIIHGDAKALPFRDETIDFCVALGLFGNLDVFSDSQSDIVVDSQTHVFTEFAKWDRPLSHTEYQQRLGIELKRTWLERSRKVINEVNRVLGPGGVFLVSNSIERQPVEIFQKLLRCFQAVELFVGSRRYLLIARKRGD